MPPRTTSESSVTTFIRKAAGHELEYTFDGNEERRDVPTLIKRLSELGIEFKDLNTSQSSLEDIFVSLVSDRPEARP